MEKSARWSSFPRSLYDKHLLLITWTLNKVILTYHSDSEILLWHIIRHCSYSLLITSPYCRFCEFWKDTALHFIISLPLCVLYRFFEREMSFFSIPKCIRRKFSTLFSSHNRSIDQEKDVFSLPHVFLHEVMKKVDINDRLNLRLTCRLEFSSSILIFFFIDVIISFNSQGFRETSGWLERRLFLFWIHRPFADGSLHLFSDLWFSNNYGNNIQRMNF